MTTRETTPMSAKSAEVRARHRRSESGQIFVWTTFLLPILLVAAGLTFDVGNMMNIRDELTSSVDAAALAGAQALHDPKTSEAFVRNSVKNVAFANHVPSLAKNDKAYPVILDKNATNAATGDIIIGRYDFTTKVFTRQSPVDITQANAVKVQARLGAAAGTLPLAFGRLIGVAAYDTTRSSLAVLGSTVSAQPTAPVAINRDVFSGKTKGFTAPDDILVSTANNSMSWTGFFGGSSAASVKGFISNPATIPRLKVNDDISLASGGQAGDYKDMAENWTKGETMLVPVCIFDPGITHGVVVGFAAVKIDKIVSTGNPKYIDGTLISFKTGASDSSTIAECFGVDCRAFLVN